MDKTRLYTPIKILSVLLVLSFLLPAFKIGGFGMKLDLLLFFPLFFMVVLIDNIYVKTKFFKKIFLLIFLIFLSMLLSDSFGVTYSKLPKSSYFPTEFLHIFSKFSVMYSFFVIGKLGIITTKFFLKLISFIFLICLSFGSLQIANISFINNLSEYYALSDNQVNGITSVNIRIFSTAGNILTWAGWSGFIIIFSVIFYKNIIIKSLFLILAFVNLLFTSSRGALLALLTSLLFYFVIKFATKKKLLLFFKYIITFAFLIAFFVSMSLTYFEDRTISFVDRFSYLEEAIFESGRNSQKENIQAVFSSDIWNYLFGIGKPVVDSIGLMENEFLFILFSYGVVGVLLQYVLIFLILKKAYNSRESPFKYIVVVGILYYLIYSFGFFFLREIYAGLLLWSIIGYYLSQLNYNVKKNKI